MQEGRAARLPQSQSRHPGVPASEVLAQVTNDGHIGMQKDEIESAEDLDGQLINEEYKVWKKNSPFLYDTVITHVLDWPSLTVDWLPTKDCPGNCDYSVQKLVLGTHTNREEPEHLIIANVKLPLDDALVAGGIYQDSGKDAGGVGLLSKAENKIEPHILINHDGEVNKARHMPQQYNLLATKGPSGDVYLYDFSKHPSKPVGGPPNPQMRLTGHAKEGFGLNWSPLASGLLASGSDDHLVCAWDVNAATSLNSTLSPLRQWSKHTSIVSDVAWSCHHPDVLASAGDDKKVIIWDKRQEEATHCIDAHSHEVNSVDFNKLNEFLLATGSSDRTVAVWDCRNLSVKMAQMEYHKDCVYHVRWAPFSGTLLASGSSDRRICIWDISRLGEELSEEDAEDGPPELIFIHGGHTAPISDLSWNANDQLVLASVAEDNILQVWQMSHALFPNADVRLPEDRPEAES